LIVLKAPDWLSLGLFVIDIWVLNPFSSPNKQGDLA